MTSNLKKEVVILSNTVITRHSIALNCHFYNGQCLFNSESVNQMFMPYYQRKFVGEFCFQKH